MEMKMLTPTILHELVERIEVYQTQGQGREMERQSRSIEADSSIDIAKEQPFDCSLTYECSVAL